MSVFQKNIDEAALIRQNRKRRNDDLCVPIYTYLYIHMGVYVSLTTYNAV